LPLRCYFPHAQIILRRDAESVGHAIEEREQRRDIYGLRNLLLRPARVSQPGNIIGGRTISVSRDEFYIIQERALRCRKPRFVELALDDCLYALL
jgi:hypothetical protein